MIFPFRKLPSKISTFILSMFLSSSIYAGVMITHQSDDGTRVALYQDNRLYNVENNHLHSMIDFNRSQCTLLMPVFNVYVIGDCHAIQAQMDTFADKFKAREYEAIAAIKAEQKRLLDKMTQSQRQEVLGEAVDVSVVKVKVEKIQGFTAQRYNVLVGVKPVKAIWVSEVLTQAIKQEVDLDESVVNIGFSKDADKSKALMFDPIAVKVEKAVESLEEKGFVVKKANLQPILKESMATYKGEDAQTNIVEAELEVKAEVINIETKSFDVSNYKVPSELDKIQVTNLSSELEKRRQNYMKMMMNKM